MRLQIFYSFDYTSLYKYAQTFGNVMKKTYKTAHESIASSDEGTLTDDKGCKKEVRESDVISLKYSYNVFYNKENLCTHIYNIIYILYY